VEAAQIGSVMELLQRVPETEISSISLAELNRFHLKTETESNVRNVVFLMNNRTMDNPEL
jgi:hypothetical protein